MGEVGSVTPRGNLTIGELARLAGVSPRAVRHYHALGLLAEPGRDSSGYRRYGSRDVIALVHVARLRAVGMPLPQIAERLNSAQVRAGSLSESLRALADQLDDEIAQLATTRDRLREMASSEAFDQPVKTVARVLRGLGLIGPDETLRTGEEWAAAMLDALHPQGIAGALEEASELLSDPVALSGFAAALERFRELRPNTGDAEVDSLAGEVAAIVEKSIHDVSLVEMNLLDKVVADRLNRAQRRFMSRLRDQLANSGQRPFVGSTGAKPQQARETGTTRSEDVEV